MWNNKISYNKNYDIVVLVILALVAAVLYMLQPEERVKSNKLKPFVLGPTKPALSDNQYTTCLETGYTVILSSYARSDFVVRTLIPYWATCKHINELHVIWHHPTQPFPPIAASRHKNLHVVLRPYPDNKITNRFATDYEFTTDALFSIDDDIAIDCRLVSAAFQTWCKNSSNTAVGFEPRFFDWTRTKGQGYQYSASCQGDCLYSTLWTTKGAFMHKKLYNLYWQLKYDAIRQAVNKAITGEDMLMSAVLAANKIKPIMVHRAQDLKEVRIAYKDRLSNISLHVRSGFKRKQIRKQLSKTFWNIHPEASSVWQLVHANGSITAKDKPCKEMRMSCSHY